MCFDFCNNMVSPVVVCFNFHNKRTVCERLWVSLPFILNVVSDRVERVSTSENRAHFLFTVEKMTRPPALAVQILPLTTHGVLCVAEDAGAVVLE